MTDADKPAFVQAFSTLAVALREAQPDAITLKPGAVPVAAEDLIAFCRERLAGFKVPKKVVFGPLPKTSTGKIQKNLLRDQAKNL
jgi:acyl-CoA synthetase (AMP-forming)/AMP-acid ligase II